MKRTNLFVLQFCVLFFTTSCLNKVDLDNIDDLTYSGQWAVPLVQANLELSDLVANDSNFVIDPDNGIRIVYQNDSIAGVVLADLIEIPDQNPESLNITSGTPPLLQDFDLEAQGGVELKYVTISSGKLEWKTDIAVNFPAQIEVTILNARLNSDTAKFLLMANGSSITDGVLDISGLSFDFTTGAFGFNNISYRVQILNDGGAPMGSPYDISIQLKEFEIQEAIGFFGERSVQLPSKIINTQIGGFENILSGLRIENPSIELNIGGNIGLPLKLASDFEGVSKNGSITPLVIPNLNYNGPANIGDWSDEDYFINSSNSNIVDFIASIPEDLSVAGEVKINPDGNLGRDNFVTNDGLMKVGLKIEIPLEFKVENLILEQWLYDINWAIEEEDKDIVEELKLHFKVTNGFPFDANLKVVFYDEFTGQSSDSVDVDLLTSAIVDVNGKVTEPTITRSVIEFKSENIQNLLESNKIRLEITLDSYNGGQDLVKLYTTDYINIAVGVQTKLNVNL